MISALLSSAFLVSFSAPSAALIASEVIPAGDIITLENSAPKSGELTSNDEALLGKQVRRTVYAGKPVTTANTRAPFVIKRNQNVTVKYISGALEISMTGRAMENASVGEIVSIMNASSRELVSGIVTEEGWILAQ